MICSNGLFYFERPSFFNGESEKNLWVGHANWLNALFS